MSNIIGNSLDRSEQAIDRPEVQAPFFEHIFDYLALIGYELRTNPRVAFIIGSIIFFFVIVIVGGILCAGFNIFKPHYLQKIMSCSGKLLIGGLIASLIGGAGFWFRASLLQGTRRVLERKGWGDRSFQTAFLMPSLITSSPL